MFDAWQQLESLGGQTLLAPRLLQAGTSLLSPGIIELTGVANLPDEEVFGPLLGVWRYERFDEAIAMVITPALVCHVDWFRPIVRSSTSYCWKHARGSSTGTSRSPALPAPRRLVA